MLLPARWLICIERSSPITCTWAITCADAAECRDHQYVVRRRRYEDAYILRRCTNLYRKGGPRSIISVPRKNVSLGVWESGMALGVPVLRWGNRYGGWRRLWTRKQSKVKGVDWANPLYSTQQVEAPGLHRNGCWPGGYSDCGGAPVAPAGYDCQVRSRP